MKRTLLFLSVALLFTATSDAERINFGWEINEVTAYREMSDINPGTGSVIGVEKSTHKAVLDPDLMDKGIMRMVSGSYLWDDDGEEEIRYSIAYNSEDVAQTTTIMEYGEKTLFHFNWRDGNLVKIYRDAGKEYFVNIQYSENPNILELLDINWMTTGKYSECYNFAGGDPSMIWAAFGYLGRSKNLIQTLEGNPADPNAYTYLTTCKTVSADHVEVEVKEYQTQSAKLTAVRNYDIRLRK